ncbi:MAG: 1,4-dihydroxy-2-naphthoate octaprenyltransferase [Candidatus Thorarchaeota archaeon]|jgi:1,4-dihydroxy-2-naphthoate octaprenyltransferase
MTEGNDSAQVIPEKPSKLKIWMLEMRVPFLTASITPVLLGTAMAWGTHGVFLWDIFLLTLIVGVCLHLGANISNDYFDHISTADDINVEYVRPFTGGSRMIQLGWLSPREVLAGSFVAFGIAAVIGIYLAFTRDMLLLVFGIVGAASGFFYTAPPFRFVSRGYGEVFIGLNFGILMVLGSYFIQVLTLAWEPVVASLPLAILITAVLYINEFPDAKADEAAGKLTIVVRLGRKRAATGYGVLMVFVYSTMMIGILLNFVSLYAMVALTTLPLAIFATRHAIEHHSNTPVLVPANAATVVNHLLTGLYLTLAYIMHGLGLPLEIVVLVGLVMLLVVLMQYRSLNKPPGL